MLKKIYFIFFASCLILFWNCSADGGEETLTPNYGVISDSETSSAKEESSSSTDSTKDSIVQKLIWVEIPPSSISRGGAIFSVNSFRILNTEVTQELYSFIVKNLPQQSNTGNEFPIENVTWYQAILFCNEFSKFLGFDTVYVYSSKDDNAVNDLVIDYSKKGIRLPTETEWEIAARAGTSTTYYWDTDVASKYAYYAQSKGPVEVKQYAPNGYSLYDMAGNVAEWVNDWYGTYASTSQENYSGPTTGSLRCVRGGGWSDKVTALASGERDKKNPLYKSHALGFRVVY